MKLSFLVIFVASCSHVSFAEKPCAARSVPGRSVVCVCNETYCDQLERQPPEPGQFVIYTSSRGGLRFKKRVGLLQKYGKKTWKKDRNTVELDPTTKFQRIEGFGGAVTDAAAINWKSLPDVLQKYLVDSYSSKEGLEYNMLRVPIGGSDFSTHPYAYNELPVNDTHLTNFTLAPEDYMYKIPLIKALVAVAPLPIHIMGSTWSPPLWMKTNGQFNGISRLKREFYQTFADYHVKFMKHYEAAGVPVDMLTTTNEPTNGVYAMTKINSLGWDIDEMGEWIENNLGPTIRNSNYSNVKIFTGDDQRYNVPFWFEELPRKHPKAWEYVTGVAVHWYADKFVPPEIFNKATQNHPDKVILATEASSGAFQNGVDLGSWDRAVNYITNILENLNYNVVGWIDWNLCLDMNGGPNWLHSALDSPIIVNAPSKEFYKQPKYYALAHVTKFLLPDSVRIGLKQNNEYLAAYVKATAFLTSRHTIVLIIFNEGIGKDVDVKCGDRRAELTLEEGSITSVEFLYK